MHVAVVLGTAREGRVSEKVARAVNAYIGRIDDTESELFDVKEQLRGPLTIAPWDESASHGSWGEVVERADALVLVVPEYNHSFPGELKILLDSLYAEYQDMPVGIVGVSSGVYGGARVADHIKPVLVELNMVPVKEAVLVGHAEDAVTDESFNDEKTNERVNALVAALKKKVAR
jgi:NAD(P)H-dependent FMN reductase